MRLDGLPESAPEDLIPDGVDVVVLAIVSGGGDARVHDSAGDGVCGGSGEGARRVGGKRGKELFKMKAAGRVRL